MTAYGQAGSEEHDPGLLRTRVSDPLIDAIHTLVNQKTYIFQYLCRYCIAFSYVFSL